MDAIEVGEHPVFDDLGIEVLDSQPWPQDRVGQQALRQSGSRPRGGVVVRAPEPPLVVRSYSADLQDRPRQALQAHRQNAYSLLDRSGELSSTCAGSTTWPGVPYFPLGSAFLGVANLTEHPAVLAAATALDATPAQVGLA